MLIDSTEQILQMKNFTFELKDLINKTKILLIHSLEPNDIWCFFAWLDESAKMDSFFFFQILTVFYLTGPKNFSGIGTLL